MSYRVGNHQPRNLYRGDQYIGVCFDPADTELIVDAMEGRTHTPDVDHTNGAREALAWVRRQLDGYPHPSEVLVVGQVRRMLDEAAAELGVSEEAPGSRAVAPEAAENASAVGRDTNSDSEGSASAYPREGWGLNRLHPTCVDVSALNEPPGSAWICITECRKEGR